MKRFNSKSSYIPKPDLQITSGNNAKTILKRRNEDAGCAFNGTIVELRPHEYASCFTLPSIFNSQHFKLELQ